MSARDVTSESHMHQSPSVGKIKLSSHQKSDLRLTKSCNIEYDTILATRIAKEVGRKMVDEHIIGSPAEFLRSKKASSHRDLQRKPFSRSWQFPKLDSYDGPTDPEDHVNLYFNILESETTDNWLLCWDFPDTHKGNAYQLFSSH